MRLAIFCLSPSPSSTRLREGRARNRGHGAAAFSALARVSEGCPARGTPNPVSGVMFLRRAAFQRLFAQRWGHALRHSVKFSCVKHVTDGLRRENNLADRERGDAWALNGQRRWDAPQPPTPHPSGERPWPLAPGSSFVGNGTLICSFQPLQSGRHLIRAHGSPSRSRVRRK
jgi:hypothetical protein